MNEDLDEAQKQMLNLFQAVDQDQSGGLEKQEFAFLLGKLNPELFGDGNEENAYNLMQYVDVDSDGKISYAEFIRYMCGDLRTCDGDAVGQPAHYLLQRCTEALESEDSFGVVRFMRCWLLGLKTGYFMCRDDIMTALDVVHQMADLIEPVTGLHCTEEITYGVRGGAAMGALFGMFEKDPEGDGLVIARQPDVKMTMPKTCDDGARIKTQVGRGNFTVLAKFKAAWVSGTAASLRFSSGHNIGLDGSGGRVFVEGGTWQKQMYSPMLKPDTWHTLEVIRKDGLVSATLDGDHMFEDCTWKELPDDISTVTLRPWRNVFLVKEFSIKSDSTCTPPIVAVEQGSLTSDAQNPQLCGAEHDCIACPPSKDEKVGKDYGVKVSCNDIGTGDFTVRLTFKLTWMSSTAASLEFSSGQQIGFDGRGCSLFTEGASWGKAQFKGAKQLAPDEWHQLVAVRSDGALAVILNGKALCSPIPMPEEITCVQVRPWRNQMRVKELSLQAGQPRYNPRGADCAGIVANMLAAIQTCIHTDVQDPFSDEDSPPIMSTLGEDEQEELHSRYQQSAEYVCEKIIGGGACAGPRWLKYALLQAKQLGASDCLPSVLSRVVDKSEVQVPPYWDLSVMSPELAGGGLHLEPGDETNLLARIDLDDSELTAFQELFDKSFVKKYTRDRRGGRVPDRLEIVKGSRVMNWQNWCEYSRKQDGIRSKLDKMRKDGVQINGIERLKTAGIIDALFHAPNDVNEKWLFHGTNAHAAYCITAGDFKVDLAGSNAGTLYGRGVYLAESCAKSDEYSEEDSEGHRCILVCRATLGNVLYNDEVRCDPSCINACINGPYQTLLGDREKCRGTFREIIVYDEDQVYPEFVLYYKRSYN